MVCVFRCAWPRSWTGSRFESLREWTIKDDEWTVWERWWHKPVSDYHACAACVFSSYETMLNLNEKKLHFNFFLDFCVCRKISTIFYDVIKKKQPALNLLPSSQVSVPTAIFVLLGSRCCNGGKEWFFSSFGLKKMLKTNDQMLHESIRIRVTCFYHKCW
jgi:hypothetical protein